MTSSTLTLDGHTYRRRNLTASEVAQGKRLADRLQDPTIDVAEAARACAEALDLLLDHESADRFADNMRESLSGAGGPTRGGGVEQYLVRTVREMILS